MQKSLEEALAGFSEAGLSETSSGKGEADSEMIEVESQLAALAEAYVDFSTNRPVLFGLMFEAKRNEAADNVREAGAAAMGIVVQVVGAGLQSGQIRGSSVSEICLALFGAIHGFASLASSSLLPQEELSAALNQLLEILWEGIRS